MAKVYCTGCKEKGHIFKSLFGDDLKGNAVWVHWCGKPTRENWESYIKRCEECFREFSNPWELICKKCHNTLLREGSREERVRLYRSWSERRTAWTIGHHAAVLQVLNLWRYLFLRVRWSEDLTKKSHLGGNK